MSVPAGNIPTTNVDSDTDRPSRARVQFLELINQFNQLVQAVGNALGVASLDGSGKVPDAEIGRGQANGVAPLNASRKIPATHLPAAGVTLNPTRYTQDGYAGNDRGVETVTTILEEDATGIRIHQHTTYYRR